jgi:hypothetical protein
LAEEHIMRNLRIICIAYATIVLADNAGGAEVLPMGDAPPPLDLPHFPSRLHAFVWRNWETADLERMAEVVQTTPENVSALGRAMGLPPHQPISKLQKQRGYISVVRRNWHLLPYDQLLTLLGWDAEQMAYTLKEDDFQWNKLGRHKPDCTPLVYAPSTPAQKQRCAEIKAIVHETFDEAFRGPADPRFAFIDRLSEPLPEPPPPADDDGAIRFLYSYFAVYGDPLLNPSLDPYPDGLLQRLARLGVNGVWLHTVLRQLAPSNDFPEFGEQHETRLATLGQLVQRARRYNIKVYLYMNEPRSMPAPFFARYPEIAGTHEGDNIAMCTSVPAVRQYVEDGLTYVFRNVPDLGGVFTITASENLTNCYSRGTEKHCPRCSKRPAADVVAEINRTVARGVWRGNPDATVIVWDWGWRDPWAEEVIRQLPDDVYLMSVSEWSLPIERGGIRTTVGEYSISAVGPGPRARRHWQVARERGLKTLAKVQVNNTWELSAVPYLPVMNLVAQHMDNLSRAGVDGQMLSWSLGGYPSPNLRLAREFSVVPAPSINDALRSVAERRYGQAAVPHVLRAWKTCSDAFTEFPFHILCLYKGPQQRGPANLLQLEPTGYRATTIGFAYDDLKTWRSVYPADIYVQQFERVAHGFAEGLTRMRLAREEAMTAPQRQCLEEDLGLMEAAQLHFASVADQARFIIARDILLAESSAPDDRNRARSIMRAAAESEMRRAARLFTLTRRDARIGYEASNHYYYYPLDLVEKVINCRHVLSHPACSVGSDEP